MWPKSIITWKYNGYNGPEFGFYFSFKNEINACYVYPPLLFSDWTWELFLAEGGFPECDGLVGFDKDVFFIGNFIAILLVIWSVTLLVILVKYYCWKDGSNDLVGNEKEIDLLLVIFFGNFIDNMIGKIDDLVGNEREIDLLLVIFVGNFIDTLIGKIDWKDRCSGWY